MKGSKRIIMSLFLIFTIFVTSAQNLQVAAAASNSVATDQKADSAKSINQIDLLKIKKLLKHQKKVFKFYDKKIYPNGVNEEATDQAIKTTTNNIKNKQPNLIPKLLDLEKVLREDENIPPFVWENSNYQGVDAVVNALIYHWNYFRDTGGSLMKAMQLAAVKKFDLPYADLKRWEKDKLDNYESYIDTIGVVLEEMKNETYKFLASKGIKELPVFRGIKTPEKINTDKNNIGSHQLAPLSSFTISKEVADDFSVPHQPGLYPYVLVEYVPINQILSLGPTGLGTCFLYEAVVIGGKDPDSKFFILPGKMSSDKKKKETKAA
ncbi:hypothetical protein JDS99_30290 [Bacillus cereus group sp. N6]|uniref:hypothetical protein n=1 Tax=Bacillus cereus group sp. N6 TaxID=2794583 RepID=UPI0018F39D87|nr:hypothetical protein [Bacillus cereus group sp. N6]MBJ8113800.1 hypothetical protein [Bacillus cereus group sp. N6]